MRREDARVGMQVIFGRARGEKTIGTIKKINLKKAKVIISEPRGSRSPAGAEWGVPYSMMEPHGGEAPEVVETEIPLYTFDAINQYIMLAIVACHFALSPENLSCDGELSRTEVNRRFSKLKRQLTGLEAALGRSVSESAAYDWNKRHEASSRAATR